MSAPPPRPPDPRGHPPGEPHLAVDPDPAAHPERQPRSLRYHDLSGSRPIPAGRVLAIGATALILAAILNADGLFELATRQPVGWKRDVATGAVAPFCALGRVTKLKEIRTEIRSAADKAVRDCSDGADSDSTFDEVPVTTLPEGPPIATRAPTADAPLRVWLGGDSMTIELSQSVEDAVVDRAEIDLDTHPQVSSGLTRPDFFDWPAYFRDEVLPGEPEVVVVMFGANDSQGMEIDGSPHQPSSEEWQAEYRRRVGVVMDQLRGDGRLVVWVGQPHMRDAGFDERMGVLDAIYAEEAEGRPWVRFLDTREILSPDGDGYQATDGKTSLRQSDGIHLDRAGADLVADAVLERIEELVIEER